MDHETIKSPEFQEEFKRIKGNFEKQSNIVFKLLSTFKNYTTTNSSQHQTSVTSPYLARLLLRLDYNGYLTDLSDKIEKEKNQRLLGDFGGGGGSNPSYY
jgi:hypothetical protein